MIGYVLYETYDILKNRILGTWMGWNEQRKQWDSA